METIISQKPAPEAVDSKNTQTNNGNTVKKEDKDEFENKEYLINTYYKSVTKSLSLFQDDGLHHRPGNLGFCKFC